MRMPWGKWRGTSIADVPSSYLAWVLEECDNVNTSLRYAIRSELSDRFCDHARHTYHYTPPPQPRQAGPNVEAAVRSWFSRLALEHHPDRGGSEEAMRTLNKAHEAIREALGIRQG